MVQNQLLSNPIAIILPFNVKEVQSNLPQGSVLKSKKEKRNLRTVGDKGTT